MTRTAIAIVLSLFAARLEAQSPAVLVKDINVTVAPATQSSSPVNFVRFGSRIFFAATTAEAGAELWSTDGTTIIATGQPETLPPLPGGLILPFAARGRRTLNVFFSDGKYRWKPPVVVDRASKTHIHQLLEHIAGGFRSVGVRIDENSGA